MPNRLKADLLLTLCTVMWGATFVMVKDALADVSPVVYLALRFLVAAVVLLAFNWRQLRGLSRGAYRAGLLIGCCMFSGYTFQTTGLALTTPSKAAFLTGFSVVLVPVLLAVFRVRKIQAWVWVGAAAAFAGLYCLTVPASGFRDLNLGDLLVLGCALMYAAHIIAVGHFSPLYPSRALTLLQVGVTAVFTCAAIPLMAVAHIERPRLSWTPAVIVAVLVTGIFATAFTFSAQVWAQQHTSASHAAIIFSLEPVVAVLTSLIFYHERLAGRAMFGGALILAGILIAELAGSAPDAPVAAESASAAPTF